MDDPLITMPTMAMTMAMTMPTPRSTPRSTLLFYRLWKDPNVREVLFEKLERESLANVRLASTATCSLLTKRLFTRLTLSFSANTFTKPSRVQALARIGHHVEHLTFHLAHSDATFLPPLIHPADGHEISFLYTPHTSMASVVARPKYANSELGSLLTQQYPPLFHAATNVPSFIHALRHLVSLRHLTVRCPGQDPRERYRRDIVDYALISLRIALERAPLTRLNRLTLTSMHPSAFNYLRHVPGFGSVPSAGKRWRQIRKLQISVEAWGFCGPSPGLDHLKIIDDYIRTFAPSLEKLSFTWLGGRGPCPIALSADPLFSPPKATRKLFNEVTSPMSPLPACPPRQPMHLPRLRSLQVRNTVMNVSQLSNLVSVHRRTVRQFDLENVVLANGGSWDDALAPLLGVDSAGWAQTSASRSPTESVWIKSTLPVVRFATDEEEGGVPSPAVRASLELLNVDLGVDRFAIQEGNEYEGDGDGEYDDDREEVGFYVDDDEGHLVRDQDGNTATSEDVDVDPAPSVSFSTTLTKKHGQRRRRRHHRSDDDDGKDKSRRHRHHRSRSHGHGDKKRAKEHSHRRHGSAEETKRSHDRDRDRDREPYPPLPITRPLALLPALSFKSAPLQLHRKPSTRAPTPFSPKGSGSPPPPHPPPMSSPSPAPSLSHSVSSYTSSVGSPVGRNSHPFLRFEHLPPPHTPPPRPPPPTHPYRHPNQPLPMVLQPTVYTPPPPSFGGSPAPAPAPAPAPTPAASPDRFATDEGISAVRRNLEQEATHRLLAEDAEMRAGALKRAREAVLVKLSQEFKKRSETPSAGYGYATSFTHGSRFRDALFAKSQVSVLPDLPRIESQTALVPLMFSRS